MSHIHNAARDSARRRVLAPGRRARTIRLAVGGVVGVVAAALVLLFIPADPPAASRRVSSRLT